MKSFIIAARHTEYSFPKEIRLRTRLDYQSTWKNGRKLHTKNFLVVVRRCGQNHVSRIGITASRKVGGAVVRNRVKRLIREFTRINYRRLPLVADISIIARPGAANLSFSQLCAELEILCSDGASGSSTKDRNRC